MWRKESSTQWCEVDQGLKV